MPTKKIDGAKRSDIFEVSNLDLIHVDPNHNARGDASFEDLSDLDSIATTGVLEPLLVRRAPKDASYKFIVILGERRLRKVRELHEAGNYVSVPVRVRNNVNAEQAYVMMAQENLNRKDFTAVEEATLVRKLKDWGWSLQKIADTVGGGRGIGWAQTRLALSGLSSEGSKMVAAGEMPIDVGTRIATECEGDDEKMAEAVAVAKEAGPKKARKATMSVLGKVPKPGKKQVKRILAAIANKDSSDNANAVLVAAALSFATGDMTLDDFVKTMNNYDFVGEGLSAADFA